MKKIFLLLLCLPICATSQKLKDVTQAIANKNIIVSEKEAESAIKEILNMGITRGVSMLSKKNGYFKNQNIKIPFPKEAKVMSKKLTKMGLKKQVDNVVLSINRAAEDAATSAKPIFVNAIKNMTVKDAVNIVKNKEASGTSYLRVHTNDSLMIAFYPIVKNSLNKVNATKYWNSIIKTYNKIPFIDKINPNLNEYVTQKAIDGLFFMIMQEEILIKKDVKKRTSDLLKKVFDT